MPTATDATDALTTAITDMGGVIFDGIVIVLGLVALLIGFFFVWRLVRKSIGSGK